MLHIFALSVVVGLVAPLSFAFGQEAPIAPAEPTTTVFPREIVRPEVPERVADVEPVLAPEPAAAAPAAAPGAPAFVLRRVIVEGSTAFDPARLEAAVSEWLGRRATFADLQAIADAIERLYRDEGYLATRAVIPPQEIADGALRVRIVEGVIDAIALRGDLGGAERRVRELLEPLVGVRPLRWEAVERRLLLARDLPGVSLLAALRAAETEQEGALVLVVDATLDPKDGFASLSNYSSDTAGPWVLTAGGGGNSVFLSGDRLQALGLLAAEIGEQEVGLVSYQAPAFTDGLTLEATASVTRSEPGDVL